MQSSTEKTGRELTVNRQELQLLKQNWQQELSSIPVTTTMTGIELLKLGTPAISTVNIGEGSTSNGQLVFAHALISILEFVGAEWSETQCFEVAELLFSQYHYWSFAELKQFIMRVKIGAFGRLYGKFSPNTLMEYAASYDGAILEARANYKPPTPVLKGIEAPEVSSERMGEAWSDFVAMREAWERELKEEKEQSFARMKQAREQHKEDMLRQYAMKYSLDFEALKKEFL